MSYKLGAKTKVIRTAFSDIRDKFYGDKMTHNKLEKSDLI